MIDRLRGGGIAMMKRFVFVFLMLCLFFTPIASWAASCYTPEQYRAEQAVRFHTNLMIMGLYCKAVMKQDTYATYQEFTRRNQNIIKTAENRLIDYFSKRSGNKAAERRLHTMRTDMANEMSLQAGQQLVQFCRQYSPYYERAKTMIPADFNRWIEQIDLHDPAVTTVPLCGVR